MHRRCDPVIVMARRACAWCVAACIVSAGCGGREPVARLGGTVVVAGAAPKIPLLVVVENRDLGVSVTAPVDAQGGFEVFTAPGRGVPEGRYRVAVIPVPRPVGDIAAALAPDSKPLPEPAGIPATYRSVETSGVTVDVRLPETRFQIRVPGAGAAR